VHQFCNFLFLSSKLDLVQWMKLVLAQAVTGGLNFLESDKIDIKEIELCMNDRNETDFLKSDRRDLTFEDRQKGSEL